MSNEREDIRQVAANLREWMTDDVRAEIDQRAADLAAAYETTLDEVADLLRPAVDFEQRAVDLAAVMGWTLDEAVGVMMGVLRSESPVARYGYAVHYPLWKRLIPGWRRRAQRQILADIEKEKENENHVV